MSTRTVNKTIWRIFVLRVSGKGDDKANANQLEVLREYPHVPGVSWLLEHFDVAIMKASSKRGQRLRLEWQRKYGLEVLHRHGRQDFLGVTLVVDGTRFVIYASTAAQLDEKNSNAFTRHLCRFITEDAFTGHADADFQQRRDAGEFSDVEHPSVINAFDATRFVRRLPSAMELWQAAGQARAAFDVKEVRVDPEAGEHQQMMWTFLAYGSEVEAIVGKIRRFVGRLNKARAGYFPYPDSAVPLGFASTGDTLRSLIPRADQQATVAALYELGAAGTKPTQIARILGTEHGVTSSDPKTPGSPLHHLQHPGIAARRLYLTRKLLAYRDHKLTLRFVGVVPNRLQPGAGHVLQRRWFGRNAAGLHDEYGAITYTIPAPPPTVADHDGNPRPGWLPGLSAEAEHAAWTDLIAKVGWTDRDNVDQDATDDQEPRPRLHSTPAARSGAPGYGDTPMMALARLCRFRDAAAGEDGPRTVLTSRAPDTNQTCGRYELHRELAAPTSDGIGKTGPTLASWLDHDLRGHLGDLLLRIWERLENAGHVLGPLKATAPQLAAAHTDSNAHQNRIDELTQLASTADREATGCELVTARNALAEHEARQSGDHATADLHSAELERYQQQARQCRALAQQHRAEIERLQASTPPPPAAPPADLGSARDVIAGLKGPFGCGKVPPAFTDALAQLLPAGIWFEPGPDSLTIWLAATGEFPLADGTTIQGTDRILIPHAAGRRPTTPTSKRLEDMCRQYMHDGTDIDTVTKNAGIANPEHTLRMIREYMLTGTRRQDGQLDTDAMDQRMPNPALRPVPFVIPILEPRAVLWHHWTSTPGRPPTATPAYARHLRAIYTGPAAPGTGGKHVRTRWAWESNIDLRLDFLTVLNALPGTDQSMRADVLARLVAGDDEREHGRRLLLDASTDLPRNGSTYPATLRRVPTAGHPDGWYGHAAAGLDPADKRISPIPCPHGCGETYATAVVFAPEVTAFGTAVLCRRCRRPAVNTPQARATAFPDSYIAWADAQPRRTGRWVDCGRAGCVKDIGAGPGRTWRWDTTPAGTVTWHDDECRIGTAPATYAACGYLHCTLDEGGGPGRVRLTHPSRRWHDRACTHAETRRQRRAARAQTFTTCAWTGCGLDEGNGPRSIAGGNWRRKTHDNPRCRNGARRDQRTAT